MVEGDDFGADAITAETLRKWGFEGTWTAEAADVAEAMRRQGETVDIIRRAMRAMQLAAMHGGPVLP
jgi:hypothetical protein